MPFKGDTLYMDSFQNYSKPQIRERKEFKNKVRFDYNGGKEDTRRAINPQTNYEVNRRRGKDHRYLYKKHDGGGHLDHMIHKEFNDIPGFNISNNRMRRSMITRKHDYLLNDTTKSKVFTNFPRNNKYNPITNGFGSMRRFSHGTFNKDHDVLNQNPEEREEKNIKEEKDLEFGRHTIGSSSRFKKFYKRENMRESPRRKPKRKNLSVGAFSQSSKGFRIPKAEKMKAPVKMYTKVSLVLLTRRTIFSPKRT